MKLEVRCCCDGRLIGHMDIEDRDAKEGRTIKLQRKIQTGYFTTEVQELRHEMYTLEVATFYVGLTRYLALKSRHIPIEVLRDHPRFQEVVHIQGAVKGVVAHA